MRIRNVKNKEEILNNSKFLVKDYKNDAKLLHFFILVILYYQQIAL